MTQSAERPRILLETSEALTYIDPGEDAAGAAAVEQLLEYSEAGCIQLDIARAGWDEIKERPGEERKRRVDRLRRGVRLVGNVTQNGEWVLGLDTLGSSVTPYVELTLPKAASRPDRNQFLVHESGGYDYLVTHDRNLGGEQPGTQISEALELRVGRAAAAVAYLQELWRESPGVGGMTS